MRYLVMFLILLSLSCGDDMATSPGDGSVDKASLIPGEYEGWAILHYWDLFGDPPMMWHRWIEEMAMTFTRDTYASYPLDPDSTPSPLPEDRVCYCDEGEAGYIARGDTLFLLPAPGSEPDSTCLPFEQMQGVYYFAVIDSILTLELLGYISDREGPQYTLLSAVKEAEIDSTGYSGEWAKTFYLVRQPADDEGGDE